VHPGSEPARAADTRIMLGLVKLDENLDPTVLRLDAEGDGHFAAEGNWLALPGWSSLYAGAACSTSRLAPPGPCVLIGGQGVPP